MAFFTGRHDRPASSIATLAFIQKIIASGYPEYTVQYQRKFSGDDSQIQQETNEAGNYVRSFVAATTPRGSNY